MEKSGKYELPDEAERTNEQRQIKFMFEQLEQNLKKEFSPPPRLGFIKKMHAIALEGINGPIGRWRLEDVKINRSNHQPPPYQQVPELMEEFDEEVIRIWKRSRAHEIAGYVMWRICWIHPFVNGSGRVARALAHYVACLKLGLRLPGKTTIARIKEYKNKQEYYNVLAEADTLLVEGKEMPWYPVSKFMEKMLKEQMIDSG